MLFKTSLAAALVVLAPLAVSALTEMERQAGFHARNYSWPPEFKPNTEGWRNLMMDRLEQVKEIDDLDRRYEGYMQTMSSAAVAPNFTQWGFGMTRAPADLVKDLRDAIQDGLANGETRLEGKIEVSKRKDGFCKFICRYERGF